MPASLGQAYVQIVPKAEGISGKIGSLIDPGAKSAGEKAGKESGEGIASGIKSTLAKLAIGATVGAGIKAAMGEGGKLQQSYGGLETIYGDAADAAKKYAVQAAQAGISANDYAEQAVSFGASLRQAFSGDTAKAAEAANTAILDMTDNAAKMGTPLQDIQHAYQGFAKQNYTMLDNLKLGYGGTKTEMERLLKDAETLTGQKYDISNLGDVYSAIHAIQGDLGLTGVAAAEASGTFTGSFGAMQASAANLLGSLTTGGDVEAAMTTLLGSVNAFVMNNFIPMLGTMFTALPPAIATAISTAVPMISEQIPQIISTVQNGISSNLPGLLTSGMEILQKISDGIAQYFPVILTKGTEIITGLISTITANLPTLLAKGAEIIVGLAGRIAQSIPLILQKGQEILVSLVTGIMDAFPQLLENAVTMLEGFVGVIVQNLPQIAQAGGEMLGALAEAIITNIPKVITAIVNMIPRIWTAFWQLVEVAGHAGTNFLEGLVGGIKSGVSKIAPVIKDIVNKITKPLQDMIGKVKDIMGKVMNKLVEVWNNIKSKAQSVWEGIKNAIANPINKAKELVTSAVSKIKGIFPISMGKIFSGIKLPHFKISGGTVPWGIGGQGTKPSVGIDWYAKGGIAKNPTLYGIGEAGNEAIVPLSDPYMKPFAKSIAAQMSGGGGNTYYITVSGAGDPRAVVDELVRRMDMKARMA